MPKRKVSVVAAIEVPSASQFSLYKQRHASEQVQCELEDVCVEFLSSLFCFFFSLRFRVFRAQCHEDAPSGKWPK